MGKSQVRIFRIELERMTNLTAVRETDPLIIAAVRLRFVTESAIQFFPVYGGDVCGHVALVIEAEHVRIARLFVIELELRMIAGKRRNQLGVAAGRPSQFKDNLLRGTGPQMKGGGRKLRAFLGGCFHHSATVVTGRALQIRDRPHRSRPLMFLMTRGTGTIFDHIRLVHRVLLMALLALAIDRGEIDAAMKPIIQNSFEFRGRYVVAGGGRLVMTLRAILREGRVIARDRS